jgi:hypothetical protein
MPSDVFRENHGRVLGLYSSGGWVHEQIYANSNSVRLWRVICASRGCLFAPLSCLSNAGVVMDRLLYRGRHRLRVVNRGSFGQHQCH